jgi:hypothetical protein
MMGTPPGDGHQDLASSPLSQYTRVKGYDTSGN